MKILIAEDNPSNRQVLETMLRKDGHTVVATANGQEAVDAFPREQPDVVIMDIMMPVMDGIEATRLIKARAGDQFTPVILLTAITDEGVLAEGIAQGGDDFLTKPFHPLTLRAKIEALARTRELYALVRAQNRELTAYQARMRHEQEIARNIFSKIMPSASLDQPMIKYRLSPARILNGDLFLAARKPNGALSVMLGDFTGHGLCAAIGAMPVSEVFHSLVSRGFSLADVVAELNHKLNRILPPTIFCAACLLDLDLSQGTLSVWNGGIPEALVVRMGQGVRHRLPSRHPPLGVLGPSEFDPAVQILDLMRGDRIYVYTDGLVEATDRSGAMFGQDRLEQCLVADQEPSRVFEAVQDALAAFCEGQSQQDDIALVELTGDPALAVSSPGLSVAPREPARPLPWRIGLHLEAAALRRLDPVSEVMRMVSAIQDLADHQEFVFMVLAELVTNAVDHGLLGLPSSLKDTPEGFAAFYAKREQALAEVGQGHLRIDLQHIPNGAAGTLVIRVEDSGPGFDHHRLLPDLEQNRAQNGRGIPLLRSLCRELAYQGPGNRVEAVYAWD